MDTVFRAVGIYAALLIILRGSGQRSLAHNTTFDLVLQLILGESTQQARVGDHFSLHDRMSRSRVDESDVLAAARERQGLERMDQIKYAVLERSGGISIVPK